MANTFIVSDESINVYGFRVLTEGIDISQFKRNPLMLYMHKRNTYKPTGDEVIGRWENIRKENGKLLADAVFDEDNDFAKKIADKVRGGFIKMASIGIQPTEKSTEKQHLKKGQTRATVTKSILTEISVVDMGGNNNALKLYNSQGENYQVEELNIKNEDMSLQTISLALGLDAEASEIDVLQGINELVQAKQTAEQQLSNLQEKQKEEEQAESLSMISQAVEKLGLKGEAQKSFEESYTTLFKADHQSAKTALSNLFNIASAKKTSNTELSAFMKDVGGSGDSSDKESTFDYLQKHNQQELARIKENDPQLYTQLAADYKKGVRYHK